MAPPPPPSVSSFLHLSHSLLTLTTTTTTTKINFASESKTLTHKHWTEKNLKMLAYPSSTLHGRATLHQSNSQPSQFLLSKQPTRFLLPATCSRVSAYGKCKLHSLSLLFSVNNGNGFGVRASMQSSEDVSESVGGGGPVFSPQPYSVKIPVGDRHVSM